MSRKTAGTSRTAGKKQSDLAELIGSRSRASEFLSRKRRLTVAQIHELHSKWGLPADELVKPYRSTVEEDATSRKAGAK